ncbi:MAG: uroporphyrinogen-III synthase [Propioniciclava sp.]
MTTVTAPLAGRRILLARRSDPQWHVALTAAGAQVDQVAFLERQPQPSHALDLVPQRLSTGEISWLVATSAHTLIACAALGHPWARLVPASVRVAAVGPASAAAVRAALGRVDLVPELGTGSTALAECFPEGPGRVLIPGAAVWADDLPDVLSARGWTVERIVVYATRPVRSLPDPVVDRWHTGGYDLLVATSGSVARAAAALLGTEGAVVVLGSAGGRVAREVGFAPVAEAAAATPGDVVRAAARLLQSSP